MVYDGWVGISLRRFRTVDEYAPGFGWRRRRRQCVLNVPREALDIPGWEPEAVWDALDQVPASAWNIDPQNPNVGALKPIEFEGTGL